MKNSLSYLFIFIILFATGCQRSQQTSTGEVRKEKLLAAENFNLKTELAQNQKEAEKQTRLLKQCNEDNKKMTTQIAGDVNEIKTLKAELIQSQNELEKLKKQLEQCQNMVDLKDVPALCRGKVEKEKKLLEQCEKEKAEVQKQSESTSEFLMKQLPQDISKQVDALTAENEQLKARIAELEKRQQDVNETPKE